MPSDVQGTIVRFRQIKDSSEKGLKDADRDVPLGSFGGSAASDCERSPPTSWSRANKSGAA